MKSAHVAIIIVHYRNRPAVERCLASLRTLKTGNQVTPIIVGNGTPDSELLELVQAFPEIQTLQLPKNTGFTGGNNAGITYALDDLHADVVLLLNDDTTVAPTFLDPLVAALDDPKVAAAVPKIYFTAGNEYHPGYHKDELGKVLWYAGGEIDWREVVDWHRGIDEVDRGQHDQAGPTPFGTGCCLAIRADVLRKYGLFDERFFLYREDVDLSLRWQQHGLHVQYTPQSQIWHDNSSSSGSGSQLHVYYQMRNRYLIGWRYAPLRTKLFLARYGLRLLRHGSPTERSAILDAVLGKYGYRESFHQPARH